MDTTVGAISLDEARRVRDAVLRPSLPPGGSVYPNDEASDTLHVGATCGGELVSVASVCREPPPGDSDPTAWRVRGMATLPRFRGMGLAGRLLDRCLTHAAAHGGRRVWCSARVGVAAFYRGQGFAVVGQPFTLPEYSDEPYIIMERDLSGGPPDAGPSVAPDRRAT